MPVSEIQTKEYECSWCGYKWINRFNGKDGPIPNNCAKCKKAKWDKGRAELITPTENGLRRRIKGFNRTCYWGNFTHSTNIIFPNDLSDRFLAIKPRSTINEMRQVLYPLGFNTRKYKYYIPDPDKPGKLKYASQCIPDPGNPGKMKYNPDNEYKKLLEQEAQKRIEIMVKIMKSRGVDYDPAPIIKRQREESLREEHEKKIERGKNKRGPQEIRERLNQARIELNAEEDETRRKKSERVKQWWASRR